MSMCHPRHRPDEQPPNHSAAEGLRAKTRTPSPPSAEDNGCKATACEFDDGDDPSGDYVPTLEITVEGLIADDLTDEAREQLQHAIGKILLTDGNAHTVGEISFNNGAKIPNDTNK